MLNFSRLNLVKIQNLTIKARKTSIVRSLIKGRYYEVILVVVPKERPSEHSYRHKVEDCEETLQVRLTRKKAVFKEFYIEEKPIPSVAFYVIASVMFPCSLVKPLLVWQSVKTSNAQAVHSRLPKTTSQSEFAHSSKFSLSG